MKGAVATALLLGAATLAAPAWAQPTIDPLFGSGAVLQRDQPIVVRGRAAPGEAVAVQLAGASARVTGDRDGRWEAAFPAMRAGGPYRLVVSAPSGEAVADDILIGDVFLCSGQSNMEMSVGRSQDASSQLAASTDPELRLLTIKRGTALAPQDRLGEVAGWSAAAPTSVEGFSAACFYMVKALRRTQKVPIGAIHSSWGGSRISAWMGDPALHAGGLGAAAALRARYARDPAGASTEAGRVWEAWWRKGTGDRPGTEPWQRDAALAWQAVPRIGYWEDWGVPALAEYNGMLWFRREVTLTAAQAAQAATLAIGPVDDADQTWVNGVPIGNGGNPGKPRSYALAAGALVAGRNVITVNANDSYGKGGMPGPADAMTLTLADGTVIPIGDGWQYAIETRRVARPPRAPWEDTAGAGTIYNAMIAPLGRIGLKGVAWYQGESDVDLPGYATRMAAMMADWRRQFGVPDLSFAIVQLAGFGSPVKGPGESGWAALREQQRQAVLADKGRAALAIAIDLGDPVDIHPGQKREVGARLAQAMRAVAYGSGEPASGPQIAAARRTPDGGVALSFDGVRGGALATRSSDRAIGFELCGPQPGSCRYAAAVVDGQSVVLTGDGKPATRVRYAWADSPVVNLFDAAWQPVAPFEVVLP